MAVVFEPIPAVRVPCGVHYLREKDQDDDFAVLYDIDLWHDNMTVHEIRIVFVCGTVVISITWL